MAITIADFLGTNAAQAPPNPCSCPACALLNCLQRPRFFAGQLISESDLNSQVDYILAKQRLHNRYLHGAGTVCGLEVLCNSCDGFVTVTPGYAISPCGDDIIVCQQQSFDVIGAIKACCNASKNKTNCDPYRPATNPGCTGLEERWCITIKYLETPTQAVTPLRNPPTTASNCGCGCGTSGNGRKSGSACGCGASTSVTPTATTPLQCEPTRILEGFQLGVVPDPGNCDSAATLLGKTLFANLLQCISQLTSYVSKLPSASLTVVQGALSGTLANSQTLNTTAYTACCQLRQAVLTVFNTSAGITDCAAVAALQAASCPPLPAGQAGGGTDPAYLQAIQDNIAQFIQALFVALRECICHNLLPPCPEDPTDDRLILACLTVKDGEILDICNFSCRQFAGAFPSFFYWLSAVPIVPIIRAVIDDLCCSVTKQADPVRGDQRAVVAKVAVNPVQQAFMDSNFALPRSFVQHLGDVAQKMTLSSITASVPVGQLNIATLNGMSVKNATAALAAHNVTFEQRQVNSRADIPLSARAFIPFATAGDHVALFVSDGNVVDAQSLPPVAAPVAAQPQVDPQELVDLRNQVQSLRADLETLRASVKSPKK
jgi:hypothetical protein